MKDIGIIILTGGKNSRMGSDKSLLEYRGKTFLQNLLNAASRLSSSILISGPFNPDHPELTYCPDMYPGHGPAAGIHAGLLKSYHELNMVLSCDLPLIESDLLLELLSQYRNEDVLLCKNGEQIHPLIGLYRKELVHHFEKKLYEGELKMMNILDDCNRRIWQVPDRMRTQLRNVNTKDEFQSLINENQTQVFRTNR